jgi:rhombotail lipoprotein
MFLLPIFLFLIAAAGCASWVEPTSVKQAGSVVDYLYPDATHAPQLEPTVTHLHPPVRVGIAFVPGAGRVEGLPEGEKQKLLQRVKDSFSQYPYIGGIELIPAAYLRAHGGFTNVEQVASMFNVEVIALVSYDQVQFNDTNALAVLYWTSLAPMSFTAINTMCRPWSTHPYLTCAARSCCSVLPERAKSKAMRRWPVS